MALLSSVILRGTRAAQPAANTLGAGTLYYVTDETKLERSTGAAWESYSSTSALSGALGATDNALLRADGTGGITAQGSAITVSDTGAITFPDGVRQTFNPDGTNAGLNVGAQAGDPSAPSDGDLWYNSSTTLLKARSNGATVVLGSLSLITETVTSASASSVTFSSITAIYRDLMVAVRGRGDTAATNIELNVTVNGDTGANYDNQLLVISGATTPAEFQELAQTAMHLGWLPAASAPANVGGYTEFWIYDYRGTTFQKSAQGFSGMKAANSAGNLNSRTQSSWWRSTAAITSVAVAASAGAFVDGTVVSLYGRL